MCVPPGIKDKSNTRLNVKVKRDMLVETALEAIMVASPEHLVGGGCRAGGARDFAPPPPRTSCSLSCVGRQCTSSWSPVPCPLLLSSLGTLLLPCDRRWVRRWVTSFQNRRFGVTVSPLW